MRRMSPRRSRRIARVSRRRAGRESVCWRAGGRGGCASWIRAGGWVPDGSVAFWGVLADVAEGGESLCVVRMALDDGA